MPMDIYVTYMSLSILLVLLATGWKKEIFGPVISHGWIMLSVAAWLILSMVHMTMKGVVIELQLAVPLCWSFVLLKGRARHAEQMLQWIVISLLVGSLLLLYNHVMRMEPKLIWMDVLSDQIALTVFTIIVFTRHHQQHFFLLTWGIAIYETAMYVLQADGDRMVIGGYSYFSIWFPALLILAGLRGLLGQLRKWATLIQHKYEKRE